MALRLHTVVSSPRASSGIRSEKSSRSPRNEVISVIARGNYSAGGKRTNSRHGDNRFRVLAIDHKSGGTSGSDSSQKGGTVPNTNYLVPFDKSPSSSCITRPLAEIFRDLNKRIPDNTLKPHSRIIPWYHANRMLSFYAPGWCGEVRDVIFSDNGSVTVIYRVTIRGSDGEAFRESTGTISSGEKGTLDDPVAAAEEIAFVRACSRFGLGLYLYHEE